jgi:hypothetical protein
MKVYAMNQLPFGSKHHALRKNTPTIALTVTFTLVLFTVVPLCYPLLGYPLYLLKSFSKSQISISSYVAVKYGSIFEHESEQKCDIFTGEWIPNPHAPYYTNTTCWAIHEHQNCMKYGRPDTGFMKWRWQPDGCELPVFNPAQFLEIVKGKSMAFVGDSVGRNQMQSLICLLSRVRLFLSFFFFFFFPAC